MCGSRARGGGEQLADRVDAQIRLRREQQRDDARHVRRRHRGPGDRVVGAFRQVARPRGEDLVAGSAPPAASRRWTPSQTAGPRLEKDAIWSLTSVAPTPKLSREAAGRADSAAAGTRVPVREGREDAGGHPGHARTSSRNSVVYVAVEPQELLTTRGALAGSPPGASIHWKPSWMMLEVVDPESRKIFTAIHSASGARRRRPRLAGRRGSSPSRACRGRGRPVGLCVVLAGRGVPAGGAVFSAAPAPAARERGVAAVDAGVHRSR